MQTLIKTDGSQIGIVTESDDTVIVIDNGADSVRRVNVKTEKTDLIVTKLSGAVALARYANRYYVGTWGDGAITVINQNDE